MKKARILLASVLLILLLAGCSGGALGRCEQAYTGLRSSELYYRVETPEDSRTVRISGEDWHISTTIVSGVIADYFYVDGAYLSCYHAGTRCSWKSVMPQQNKAPAPDWMLAPWEQLQMQLLRTETAGETTVCTLTSAEPQASWVFTFQNDTLTALEVTQNDATTRYEFLEDTQATGTAIRQLYDLYSAEEVAEQVEDD